jgi:hypothetical protein
MVQKIESQTDIKHYSNSSEVDGRKQMLSLLQGAPIPEDQLLSNIGLFLDSKNLARILFMDFLYKQAVDIQGVVMEFGTRWGQNGALFSALRSIYEPFNRHRKIVLFDTFEGFPSIAPEDGKSDLMKVGQLTTASNYDGFLDKVMSAQESVNPLSHIKKYQICKGDATQELAVYLKNNPESIVSLAYFDFDIYKPTKDCLNLIADRLTKGSVIGFDELNDPDSPGETLALMEVFGLRNINLRRFRYASRVSYFIVE